MVCDYYEILGVFCSVDKEELKCVYCCLVCKYYLDVNKELGLEECFKEINRVYEIFLDLEMKVCFDCFGEVGVLGGVVLGFLIDFLDSFVDIFESFFSGFGGVGI